MSQYLYFTRKVQFVSSFHWSSLRQHLLDYPEDVAPSRGAAEGSKEGENGCQCNKAPNMSLMNECHAVGRLFADEPGTDDMHTSRKSEENQKGKREEL